MWCECLGQSGIWTSLCLLREPRSSSERALVAHGESLDSPRGRLNLDRNLSKVFNFKLFETNDDFDFTVNSCVYDLA